MSDTRADTTSMGLFLISFIMLVFGIVGIFAYQGNADAALLTDATYPMMVLVGFLFFFVAVNKYKEGDKFLMTVFAFLAFFALGYGGGILTAGAGAAEFWLYYIVVAVFLLVFTLVALLKKAPFMLAIILLSAALVFLFFALAGNAIAGGNDPATYYLIMGVFGFIAFIVSIYMALNDAAELNLPVM